MNDHIEWIRDYLNFREVVFYGSIRLLSHRKVSCYLTIITWSIKICCNSHYGTSSGAIDAFTLYIHMNTFIYVHIYAHMPTIYVYILYILFYSIYQLISCIYTYIYIYIDWWLIYTVSGELAIQCIVQTKLWVESDFAETVNMSYCTAVLVWCINQYGHNRHNETFCQWRFYIGVKGGLRPPNPEKRRI